MTLTLIKRQVWFFGAFLHFDFKVEDDLGRQVLPRPGKKKMFLNGHVVSFDKKVLMNSH